MKMKKKIRILIAFLLVVSVVSGCTGQTAPTVETTVSTTAAATTAATTAKAEETTAATTAKATEAATPTPAPAPKVNEYGWEVPEKTIEFTVYKGQYDQVQMDEYTKRQADFVLENFNVKITNIWSADPAAERLNLMLASGDYPDAISAAPPATIVEWANQKKAVLLNPYLDAIGGNFKTVLGKALKRVTNDNGENYYFPACSGSLEIPVWCGSLRWDWWQEIGAPKFTTPQEFVDILIQISANHPTNARGEKIYPLSGYASSSASGGLADMIMALQAAYGLGGTGWAEDESHNLRSWINTPEGTEIVKFINRLYRDKLIDPDSYIQNLDQWTSFMVNERAIGIIGSWSSAEQPLPVWLTEPDYKDTKRLVQFKLQMPGTSNRQTAENQAGYWSTFITDKAVENGTIDGILKWFEFELSENGSKVVGWGVPNEADSIWDFKDGKGTQRQSVRDQFAAGTFEYMKAIFLGWNRFWNVASVGPFSDGTRTFIDANVRDMGWKKVMFDNLAGLVYDATDFLTIVVPPDSEQAVIALNVKDILDKGLIKCFSARTEVECVAELGALRAKLATAQLAKYEQFYTEQYKKNLAKSGN
jgi:ABC-type glycerol-3-phosphate transport system substrate-binding protein